MNVCPTPSTDANYRALYELLGGSSPEKEAKENALKASYRMWRAHEDMNPGNGSVDALTTFRRSSDQKLKEIQKYAKNLELDKSTHTYTWAGDPLVQVRALSKALDDVLETPFHEIRNLSAYSESGTAIHELFSNIVAFGDRTNENIKRIASDYQIPDSLVDSLFALKDNLAAMGTLVTEQMLYTEGTVEDVPIAGTADIIVYAPDGRKYVIDLKTVYNTKAVKDAKRQAWDPLANNAQKAKRYTAQTMAYGRMTEWADRQAVTDHYIVPIELELNDDTDLSKGYKSAKMLPMTSVNDWGYTEYATRVLDKLFNVSSTAPSTSSIIGTDDSSQIYRNLTGDLNTELSQRELAKDVSRGGRVINGRLMKGYYSGSTFIPFNDQNDPEAQIDQIERDYVKTRGKINADLSYGIKNYMESGDSKYLKSIGDRMETLKKLLGQFVGRRDVNILNLRDIKGFEDKKNWILIEEGKTRHLFYIGADNMRRKFDTVGIANDSLFGKHADKIHTSRRINSSLKNNIGDARSLEGTLIAVKLKESNPDIRFGLTMVHGLSGSGYSNFIDLKENLATLGNIMKDSTVRKALFDKASPMLEALSRPEVLDYSNYRPDFLDMLGKYMDFRREDPSVSPDMQILVERLTDSAKAEADKKAELEMIAAYMNEHVRMGHKVDTDYETYLLSAHYMQMQDMDVSLLPIGLYRKWAGLPQNITNPLLQQVNKKLGVSVNEMSRAFRDDYKTKFSETLVKYLNSKGLANAGVDVLTGNVARHYEELFQPITKKIRTDKGVETTTLPGFNLKMEGSDEFNRLSPEAQALVRAINQTVMDFAQRNRIKWQPGRLPLVRATVANRLRNERRTGGIKAYGNLVNTMLTDLEANFGAGEDTDPISDNIFAGQWNDEISDNREDLMGYQADDFLNLDDYHKWTTDVESMMDVFVIQGLKRETLRGIGGTMRAINSIFQWHSSNLMENRLGLNIDWVNHVKTVNLDNRDIDSGTPQNRAARMVTRAASIGLYAFNPVTAMTAWMGNEFTTLSESIANSLSKSNRFSTTSLFKAKGIMAGLLSKRAFDKLTGEDINNMEKVSLLMQRFRMFNEDISSLLNGYHRVGDKFLFRSKHMFSMLNAGDFVSRMNITVAQLVEEGSWDAYSTKDGKLVYDESKDERFNGKGKLTKEEARALRDVIARNNGQSPTDPLTLGHDDSLGDSLRGLSNYLLGTNDRESRATMNFIWWGKIFGASKNWLTAKLDRWIMGMGSNKIGESALIGEYVFQQDKDGNTYAFWKGDHMEGIMMSWLSLIDNLRRAKEDRVPLTTIQKNNITRSLADLALVMAASMLATSIPDDDDETTRDDMAALILRRSTDDLLTVYNLALNPKFLWTPVSLEWMSKTAKLAFKGVMQADPDKIMKALPVLNQLERYYEIMKDEDFELTEK